MNAFYAVLFNLFREAFDKKFSLEEIAKAFPDYEPGIKIPDANWTVVFLQNLTGVDPLEKH